MSQVYNISSNVIVDEQSKQGKCNRLSDVLISNIVLQKPSFFKPRDVLSIVIN